jgi:predicted membrane protein
MKGKYNKVVKRIESMKKRKLIIVVAALFTTVWAHAQEFKLAKNSGRLEIYAGNVTVEGHNGNDIIFSTSNYKAGQDKRAAGLHALNGLGLDDNTGLGINVADKGNAVEVRQLSKTSSHEIKILVPKGIIVSFSHESQYGGNATFRNMTNEIEVSAQYNSIKLENVTGPLTVKTIYGHVDAVFDNVIKDPISIVSIYGHVDVALPQTTKANLTLSTSYGEVFVAPEFNIKVEASTGGMVKYSDKISGTINGGGINMELRCDYGKVYLRKK